MSYFGIKVGNFYKVGKIYSETQSPVPFWYFYVNCYTNEAMGKQFYGVVKIVSHQRRMVNEGEYVRIESIEELRLARGYNKNGGISQYLNLICTLSKSEKEIDDGYTE